MSAAGSTLRLVDEAMMLSTLDTEAYEAALEAAMRSLLTSDFRTGERLHELAVVDGVVGEAARKLLQRLPAVT